MSAHLRDQRAVLVRMLLYVEEHPNATPHQIHAELSARIAAIDKRLPKPLRVRVPMQAPGQVGS